MLTHLRRRAHQEGFTLIETIVVVLIIAILALIAIPAYLSQRNRAWQSELQEAVRNTALEIESQAPVAVGTYPYEVRYSTTGKNSLDPMTTPAGELSQKIIKDRYFKSSHVTLSYRRDHDVHFALCGVHHSLVRAGGDFQGVLMYDTTLGGLKAWDTSRHDCNIPGFMVIE